jgi:hypothetical protein
MLMRSRGDPQITYGMQPIRTSAFDLKQTSQNLQYQSNHRCVDCSCGSANNAYTDDSKSRCGFYRNGPSGHTERLTSTVRDQLRYLRAHPLVRTEIHAPERAMVLYSGTLFLKAFEELRSLKGTPEGRHLVKLEEVLKKVEVPDTDYPNLNAYANAVSSKAPHDEEDTLVIWRALFGIYAAQASGQVSFYVGTGVSRDKTDLQNRKVFALTEVHVLARNGT